MAVGLLIPVLKVGGFMRDEDMEEDSADIRVEAVIFSFVSFFTLVDFRGSEVGFLS